MPALKETGGAPQTVVSACRNNYDRETGGAGALALRDFDLPKTGDLAIMATNQLNTANSGV